MYIQWFHHDAIGKILNVYLTPADLKEIRQLPEDDFTMATGEAMGEKLTIAFFCDAKNAKPHICRTDGGPNRAAAKVH